MGRQNSGKSEEFEKEGMMPFTTCFSASATFFKIFYRYGIISYHQVKLMFDRYRNLCSSANEQRGD